MADEAYHIPEWVRRRDGGQVPFDADRICQALFAASEALGEPNAFLARELTDAVCHFLAQESFDAIPTTLQIAEHVEKVVREVGQPLLARRYAELQAASPAIAAATAGASAAVAIHEADLPGDLVQRCLQTYSLHVMYSSDLRSATEEGLLHLSGLTTPATLTSYVVDARLLGAESWWFSWDPWKACGAHWIVDSPEWLSILLADRLPIVRLCERIVSLHRAANRAVELHLNTAEPPSWIHSQGIGPLFVGEDNPFSLSHRLGFLDMLLEQCLALREEHAPALAWHVHDEAFRDPAQLARLKMLLRQAAAGKAVRFIFDRPASPVALSEGVDRPCPGVLLEVGLDLAVFARRPDIAHDGAALLKKLPSLARMAVSAADQKRRYLRRLPEDAPLQRGFLMERAVGSVAPLALDETVRSITGQGMTQSPLALKFGLQILRTLRNALRDAGRSLNLDLPLDSPAHAYSLVPLPEGRNGLSVGDASVSPEVQLQTAGQLHDGAGSGTAVLLLADAATAKADALAQLLQWAWQHTAIVRLELDHAGRAVQQGELPI